MPGGGPGTDPEMSEYLRRLAMARIDYEELRGEIGRRFPGERFLIVHCGDHHPIATRSLGFNDKLDAEDISLPLEVAGLHHLLRRRGHQLPAASASRCRDAGRALHSACHPQCGGVGISFRARQKGTPAACNGRYFTCASRYHIGIPSPPDQFRPHRRTCPPPSNSLTIKNSTDCRRRYSPNRSDAVGSLPSQLSRRTSGKSRRFPFI